MRKIGKRALMFVVAAFVECGVAMPAMSGTAKDGGDGAVRTCARACYKFAISPLNAPDTEIPSPGYKGKGQENTYCVALAKGFLA